MRFRNSNLGRKTFTSLGGWDISRTLVIISKPVTESGIRIRKFHLGRRETSKSVTAIHLPKIGQSDKDSILAIKFQVTESWTEQTFGKLWYSSDRRTQGGQQFPRAEGWRGRQRLLGDECQRRVEFGWRVGFKLIHRDPCILLNKVVWYPKSIQIL